MIGWLRDLFRVAPDDPRRCEVKATYASRNEERIFTALEPLLQKYERQPGGFIKLLQGERNDLLFYTCESARSFVAEAKRLNLPIRFHVGKQWRAE